MNIAQLKSKYNSSSKIDVEKLFRKYQEVKKDTILDALTASIGVSAIFNENKINFEAITPRMEEAFNLSFPNKNIGDIANLEPDQISGFISNWKGKFFELDVNERLNNGEIVGDISLGEGQYSEIAENLSQPGWDLQIFNNDGTVSEYLQLKATNSLSYINKALTKYPDIDILSTSEIANLNNDLIDSNISLEEIESPMTELFDSNEDIADLILPGLPFIIIAISESKKVFIDKKDAEIAIQNAIDRSAKTGVSMGAGILAAYFTNVSFIGIATTFFTRWLINQDEKDIKTDKITHFIKLRKPELLLLKESYP